MTVDADVKAIAAQFGVDPALIQAVVAAEGNILRAVQCSLPSVQTREKALDVTCRSAVHAMSDFLAERGLRAEFVAFWQRRWAPISAANDPTHLNANWSRNVQKLWGVVALLVLCALPASAQSLPTEGGRTAANVASWVTLGANLALQTADALQCPDKKSCLLGEALQLATTGATVWAVKSNTDSPRPCATFETGACTGDDAHRNIPSGHTAFATQAAMGGRRIPVKLALAGATAALRLAAGMHDWKGVTSGAAVGAGSGVVWTVLW